MMLTIPVSTRGWASQGYGNKGECQGLGMTLVSLALSLAVSVAVRTHP